MRTLSYVVKHEPGQTLKAIATCSVCSVRTSVGVGGSNNPEAIAKRFRLADWDFDPFSPRDYRCPQHAKKGTQPIKPKEVAVQPPADRSPTPTQKKAIRDALDGNFDEEIGRYLDGLTDQKVAEKIGVPHAWVREIREKAYGEIKVNPDIEAIGLEVGRLSIFVKETEQAFGEKMQAVVASIKVLHQRLDKLEAK
jgi:hypothetical protein